MPAPERLQTSRSSLVLMAAVVGASCLAALFLPWDAGRRNSFALLATVERNELLPDALQAKTLLVWWVLQPVLLGAVLISLGVQLRQPALRNALRSFRAVLAVPAYLSVAAFGFVASRVPGATSFPLSATVLSVLGLFVCVVEIGVKSRRRREPTR
jgi:hypothetical protein